MQNDRTYSDKATAGNKAIGFDFQYYYFLLLLLNLKEAQSVGLEVKDDVHIDLSNGYQTLIQLKHTIQERADGSPKNLTTSDIDLHKTLANWSKIISDPKANRATVQAQVLFVDRTDFLLVSNKSNSQSNSILKTIRDFQTNSIPYAEAKNVFLRLMQNSKDSGVRTFIKVLLDLDDDVLKKFFYKLNFELNVDNIILRCKQAVKEKMVPENRVDDVFRNLDSQVREDNFITIRHGSAFAVTFNDFYKRYRRHFDRARNPNLQIKKFQIELPEELHEQTFLKQLLDINDIDIKDDDSVVEFTRCKLSMENNLEYWRQEGELTKGEIEEFEREAIARWKNKFRAKYRGAAVNDDDIDNRAIELVDSLRNETLKIDSIELGAEMSNGEYYRLSDIPHIGWRKDWEDLYK